MKIQFKKQFEEILWKCNSKKVSQRNIMKMQFKKQCKSKSEKYYGNSVQKQVEEMLYQCDSETNRRNVMKKQFKNKSKKYYGNAFQKQVEEIL